LLGCYLFLIYCRKLTWYKKSLYRLTDTPIYKKCSLSLYYIICCSCILKDRCLILLTPNGEFGSCTSQCICLSRLLMLLQNSSLFYNLFLLAFYSQILWDKRAAKILLFLILPNFMTKVLIFIFKKIYQENLNLFNLTVF